MTRAHLVLGALALAGAAAAVACSLNPQPIPPGFDSLNASADAGGAFAEPAPPTSTPGAGPYPSTDAGVPEDQHDAGGDANGQLQDDGGFKGSDAGDGGADAGDASTDAPPE